MKTFIKTRLIILIATGFSLQTAFAQAPQGLNYQAIARSNTGAILPNQNIGLEFTITNGNGGSILYEETQAVSTNQLGLFSVNLGSGVVKYGVFDTIPWATTNPYLKVGMDPSGSNNYIFMGTSQLLSVPYALYAASTASAINGTQNYLVKFTSATTGGNSVIYDNGTYVGIGTSTPSYLLDVKGSVPSALSVFNNSNASGIGFAGQNNAATGSGAGIGVIGQTQQSGGAGVFGGNLSSTGSGVVGVGNNTPYTLPTTGAGGAFFGSLTGTYGFSAGNTGFGVYGKATNTTSSFGVVGIGNGVGIYGPGPGAGGAFTGYDYGVSGSQTDVTSGVQTAAGSFSSLAGTASATTTLVEAYGTDNTHYKIWGDNTSAVATSVPDLNGNHVTLHAPETPEFYFQDFGQSKLINGKVHIDLDPVLAKNVAISEKHPLRVFVQLEGDCNGVYVTNKTATGFDVVELNNGISSVSFQWSVTCNVADAKIGNRVSHFADLRFEPGPINVLKNLSPKDESKGTK